MQYPLKGCKTGFTGSIAAAFADTLIKAAKNYGIEISEIQSSPMNGLAKFHSVKS
jgi:hypothetical protein